MYLPDSPRLKAYLMDMDSFSLKWTYAHLEHKVIGGVLDWFFIEFMA